MKITRKNKDALNSTISIILKQTDFSGNVMKVLKDYQKKANIPGFRQGHVPIGLIKNKYETSIIADEVNKILQETLTKYIQKEKLEILGNPMPILKEKINWKSQEITFDFEIGLSPNFELKLKSKKSLVQYKIEADSKMVNEQLFYLQKKYGKLEAKTKIIKSEEISVQFLNQENEVKKNGIIELNLIKNKKIIDLLKSSKINDTIEVKAKDLFKDENDYNRLIGIPFEKINKPNSIIKILINEINLRKPAELNTDFFNKLYKHEKIKTVTELKNKIKNEIEKQYENQSDQKLFNDVTKFLTDINKFNLPKDFLIKWMQNSGEKPLSEEESKKEYVKSEKGIRYQLIEEKIIISNKLQIESAEMKSFAKEIVKNQMAQYGRLDPEEKELEGIVNNIFKNKDEAKRLSDQLMSKKLLKFYKENLALKVKKVNYESFIKEAYSSKQ